jgi:solute carrier family 8 (sodium/calcium exchanger)
MALGSSAPEILLSVIGTVSDLESLPSKLGPSTIVGSAAFNLLVISGACILAVDDQENQYDKNGKITSTIYKPKQVYDTGVFAVTAIWSIFAYIWLYIVLKANSDEVVETWEAWVTFVFFFILIIMAFAADRYKANQDEKVKSEA